MARVVLMRRMVSPLVFLILVVPSPSSPSVDYSKTDFDQGVDAKLTLKRIKETASQGVPQIEPAGHSLSMPPLIQIIELPPHLEGLL